MLKALGYVMICQKQSLHNSCRMSRCIVVIKLICSLGHCECDCHTVHKLSSRRLTADWLAPLYSNCSRMHSKVSSDWLPSYIKATRPVLEIFKMAGYFPDSPRIYRLYRELSEQDRREGHSAVRMAWLDGQSVRLPHPIPYYWCTYRAFASQVSVPSKNLQKKNNESSVNNYQVTYLLTYLLTCLLTQLLHGAESFLRS